MNNKIKNVGIVLTTGILLGFGTSATLADNVIGVGMYGTQGNALGGGLFDTDADAVSYNDGTGEVQIQYGEADGLSFNNGNSGQIVSIHIDDGGSEYLAADSGHDGEVDNTGTSGHGLAFTYDVDGDAGSMLIGNTTVATGGTGYVAEVTGGGTAADFWTGVTWSSVNNAGTNDCATDQFAGTEAADGGAGAAGITALVIGDCAVTATFAPNAAQVNGDICTMTYHGGVGYTSAGGGAQTMEFLVNGVVDPAYTAVYTTNGSGTIDLITMTQAGTGTAVDGDEISVNITTADADGTGFTITTCELAGAITGLADFSDGVDCDSSLNFEATFENYCTNCTTALPGIGASFTYTAAPTGSLDGITFNALGAGATNLGHGSNYNGGAPAVQPAAADSAAAIVAGGTAAVLTAHVDSAEATLFWPATGASLDLEADAEWDFLCGADYNDDGTADLVAHSQTSGNVYIYCLGNDGAIEEELVSEAAAGTAWSMVGQLDANDNMVGHCILWHNASSGASAIWNLDGGVRDGDMVLQDAQVVDSADSSWSLCCTNDAAGGGNKAYWHNAGTGRSAVWFWHVTDLLGAGPWVTSKDYINDSAGAAINAGPGWMIEAVGCLNGAPTGSSGLAGLAGTADYAGMSNPQRDICWSNSDGGAAVWLMEEDSNSQVAAGGAHFFNVNGSDTTAGSITSGNRIVGVGQNNVDVSYVNGGVVGADLGIRRQTFASIWWNRSGNTTVWRCDRTLSLQTWTASGPGAGETGLTDRSWVIDAHQQY